jgi:hypothetical protein
MDRLDVGTRLDLVYVVAPDPVNTDNRATTHDNPDSSTVLEALDGNAIDCESLESQRITYCAELNHYLQIGNLLQAAQLRGKLMRLAYQRRKERHARRMTVEGLESSS